MSSVTVSYSDLDARTEFVLNRVAFLESVTEVLQHENKPENKQKVAVWRDNNYIPLIVRCIMDNDENIYDRAIWATGNLLVSDDKQVVAMTRTVLTDDVLKRLVQKANYFTTLAPTIRKGIYYLFSNLSKYDMPVFFTEAIGSSLMKTVLTDKYGVMDLKAQIDFLETVKNIAKKDPSAIDELYLIDALFDPEQSQNYSRIFHIIGTLAEQDSMIGPLGIRQLMVYFTEQLATSEADISSLEMLWVLSNIMTEPSAPELFSKHKELKNLVESIAWEELATLDKDADETIGYEALFVLVNYVTGAKHLREEFQKNLANDTDLASLFGTCMVHHNPKVVAVAREGHALISQLISTFNPPLPEVTCITSDTECEDTERDIVVTIENNGKSVTTCEMQVPSASDLVLGVRRGNESGAVRRVVSLLVNSPIGAWVEVPSDWTLTISDLTTLQHLGYTIKDGQVGINPELYSTY